MCTQKTFVDGFAYFLFSISPSLAMICASCHFRIMSFILPLLSLLHPECHSCAVWNILKTVSNLRIYLIRDSGFIQASLPDAQGLGRWPSDTQEVSVGPPSFTVPSQEPRHLTEAQLALARAAPRMSCLQAGGRPSPPETLDNLIH